MSHYLPNTEFEDFLDKLIETWDREFPTPCDIASLKEAEILADLNRLIRRARAERQARVVAANVAQSEEGEIR
jgi:hypothetical protein